MAITIDEVKHLAKLAKLEFAEEELPKIARELDAIVGYMEQLEELDVADIPATSHVLDLYNVFRGDKVAQENTAQDILQNAPVQKMGYFSVPKVIG